MRTIKKLCNLLFKTSFETRKRRKQRLEQYMYREYGCKDY